MDYVHIDKLLVSATHGHYEAEWSKEQKFEVSLKAGYASSEAGMSDDLATAIDYDFLKVAVTDTLSGTRRFLVEKLAEEIAERILTHVQVHEVSVTIKKLEIWDNGIPGTTITRTR